MAKAKSEFDNLYAFIKRLKVFEHVSQERLHDAALDYARLLRLVKRQESKRKRLTTAIRKSRQRLERALERVNECKRVDDARKQRESMICRRPNCQMPSMTAGGFCKQCNKQIAMAGES